jgi:hypothetical protein
MSISEGAFRTYDYGRTGAGEIFPHLVTLLNTFELLCKKWL